MRLALYQPDIPQNTGTIVRLCACLGAPLEIIEPCGFTFTDRQMKRAALDYGPLAEVTRHISWDAFRQWQPAESRLILMTTKGAQSLYDVTFRSGDILLMGSEQTGVPDDVHTAADRRVAIPMVTGARSLNVAVAAGMALSEMRRQINNIKSEVDAA